MKKLNCPLALVTGVWAGLLIAQALFTTAARNGGSPGGEVLALLAIPLLLLFGYSMGHDARQEQMYYRGYRHGYRYGYNEAKNEQEVNSHDGCK